MPLLHSCNNNFFHRKLCFNNYNDFKIIARIEQNLQIVDVIFNSHIQIFQYLIFSLRLEAEAINW